MKRMMLGALLLGGLLGLAAAAGAATDSPVGKWQTVDDKSGKPRSIVEITEKGGRLVGTIEHIFPQPDQPADPVCEKCQGDRKNKPILGMEILWGLKPDGDHWSGGKILDPENGKTYKSYIELEDGGRRLKVRGYRGLSFAGRTQHWERVE